MNRKRKQSRTRHISPQQLAQFGIELISHDPLVVRCILCGAEWRPVRLPQSGTQNTEWRCQNGCCQRNIRSGEPS